MHISSRGIVIIDDKVVLMHRIKKQEDGSFRDYYIVPGGKAEEGETLEETVVREVHEELGIIVKPERKILEYNSSYNDSIQNFFECKYESGELGTGDGPEYHQERPEGDSLEMELVSIYDIDKINLIPSEIKPEIEKLKQRRYSYFIIKPDGIRRIDEIFQDLSENFENLKLFKIDDFASIIKKLYFRHYEKRGQSFANSFEQYLQASEGCYGNEAILVLVSNGAREDYQKFRERVYKFKIDTRGKYSNENVRILSNIPTTSSHTYVRVFDENGNDIEQRSFREKGNYRINELNVIHSPDSDIQSTEEELQILLREGVIREDRMISQQSLKELLRFKTITGYQTDDTEIKPNISGFLNKDIEENTDFIK